MGIAYIVPISVSIIVLLAIVYFSYCQTIQAYPGGGGAGYPSPSVWSANDLICRLRDAFDVPVAPAFSQSDCPGWPA